MFRLQLQQLAHPHLFTATPGTLADPLAVIDSVAEAFPGWQVSGVEPPTTARPTYLAYVIEGPRFETVLIDPVTTRVLGTLPEVSWVRALQSLHYDLLSGRRGRVANGVGALALVLMCLTGLVIWWPGVRHWSRGFTIAPGRSRWGQLRDIHGIVGALTVAATLMWAVTGAAFVFPAAFRAAVGAVSPLTIVRAPAVPARDAGASLRPLRELVDVAITAAGRRPVARVVLPASNRAALLVMFAEASPTPAGAPLLSVYLDPATGRVLQSDTAAPSWGDTVMRWMPALHIGTFGGAPLKVAWALLGVCPAVLFFSGFALWWRRVVRPRWTLPRRP